MGLYLNERANILPAERNEKYEIHSSDAIRAYITHEHTLGES